jgi:hypothetical protein
MKFYVTVQLSVRLPANTLIQIKLEATAARLVTQSYSKAKLNFILDAVGHLFMRQLPMMP